MAESGAAVAGIGAFTQAFGQIAGAIQGARVAKLQGQIAAANARQQKETLEVHAQQAEYNAIVAGYDATLARQAAAFREQLIRRQGARVQGANRAAIGASGVTLAGSPLQVLVDNAYDIETDARLARYAGELQAHARERERDLSTYQAAVHRYSGDLAVRSAKLSGDFARYQGTTALTGGTLAAAGSTIRGLSYFGGTTPSAIASGGSAFAPGE